MLIKSCLLAVLASLSLAEPQGRQQGNNGVNFGRQQQQQVQRNPQQQKKPAGLPGRQGTNAATAVQQANLTGKRPQGQGCRACSSSSSSYYVPPPQPCHGECNRINVMPDAGFYSFAYAGSNTFSPRSFYVCTDKTLFLSVTNCFLAGDYFEVFDNGQPILITDEGNNFPGFPANITEPVNDPSTCLGSLAFNHGSAVLNPGTHLLTVLVGASWYSGGAGFLRVDTACLIGGVMMPCCMGDGDNGASCPQFIVA